MAILLTALRRTRGESTAPSLGGGSVVLRLRAVLWAAPTAWRARRRLRPWPYTPRLTSCASLARLSRGARWGYPRMPSLRPPEGLRWPGSSGGHQSTGLPPRTTASTPSMSSRGYPWVRCTLRPARLRAHLRERLSGNLVRRVTRGTHAVGPLPRATRARCPLPGPDFHRRVPAYPRHAVRYLPFESAPPLISLPHPPASSGP